MNSRDRARVLRAMRSAARAGFDPYNSADVMQAAANRAARKARKVTP